MAQLQRPPFSVTLCAGRKPGMSEDDCHKYISETHASHLKDLLVKTRIIDYSMVQKALPHVTTRVLPS